MIYCVDPNLYPAEGQFVEEHEYQDENDFTWKIARVENGFFIRFFGNTYFQDTAFDIKLSDGVTVIVNNTNCIFVADNSFDTFYHFREILQKGWTDDIWDAIKDFLKVRLEIDSGLLESEIYTGRQWVVMGRN